MPIPPREECKFPAGREPATTALGHTFVPPAEKGLRLGDLGRREGRRDVRCGQGRAKKKVMKRVEKRIPRRRGIIFGDVIRDSWKRRAPLIAIAAEKRDARAVPATVQSDEIARNYARARA